MAEYKLTLEKRELTGRKSKELRRDGLIPSTVYGGKEPVLTASKYVETEKVLGKAGYHSPVDLDIAGKKQMAIVKDVQIDPVSRMILNVEFQAISAKEIVTATAPIVVIGFDASEAAKTHHFAMTHVMEEIEIKAKPADLPEELTIDATNMVAVEDKLTVADIKLPKGVEFADKELDQEQVVVSLYDPAAEAEKREAEAEAEGEADVATPAEAESEEKPTESEDKKAEE